MYEYRFNENRIERWPLATSESRPSTKPYSNSAESTPWESAEGSSPDSQPQPLRPPGYTSGQMFHFRSSPDYSQQRRHPLHRTSPVSPKDFTVITPPTTRRRSALRQQGRPSSSRPTKTVQWVSDLKKRPQDISSDRKIVKVQVHHRDVCYTNDIRVMYSEERKKISSFPRNSKH